MQKLLILLLTLIGSTAVTVAQISPIHPAPKTVSLALTGDVMMGTNFPGPEYVTKDRGRSLFVDCKEILQQADASFMNLEGTCYEGTDGELRKMTNPNTYFIFRMPGDHAQNLADAGVDAVNLANNHSFDFGKTGRRKTIENVRSVGVEIAGISEEAEGCVLNRNGVKIAYVSFAASCTKVNDMLNEQVVDSLVKKYRRLGDVLVVGFHGGGEGVAFSHIDKNKTEYYVGECRGNVYRFAHRCIDLGADIVVGHGPHVPRAMELYKGHLIAYSLGNFCGPYRLGMKGKCGYAPLLVANVNVKDGVFSHGKIHSFLQRPGIGPRNDDKHQAAREIRQLTLDDFPETNLTISEEGDITLRTKKSE